MPIYTKNLTQKYETDVFIAGGGPAGFAAAVACARMGKSVFLAESHGCFGGAGTTGLVPAFMRFGDGVNFLAGGIGREIRDALYADRSNDAYGYCIKVEELKRLYDSMALKAGFRFSFFTHLTDIVCDCAGHIDYAVLSAKSGMFAVKAKVYIDATGDGDLCAWAGADYALGDENGNTMPATLCSLWAGISFDERGSVRDDSQIEQAIQDGVFSFEDRHLPGISEIDRESGIGGGNIGHCFGVDATNESSLTSAMIHGRLSMTEYIRFYREYLPGFQRSALALTADMLGVRESRRIVCDYTLTAEDFRNRAVFADEIGRYCYPVDIHIMAPSKEAYEAFLKEYAEFTYGPGESYGIPYRALIPSRLSNALVAGRCISTDRQMQASVRVMPGCYITGQAAGIAAALACDCGGDARSVHTQALHKSLRDLGAYLPNAAV